MTSRNKAQAGFTLLEMLVTVAVMGIVLAVLAGFMRPHSHRLEMEAAARDVARAMRTARATAIADGTPVTFAMPAVPAWLTVAEQAPRGGILFAADGSSSGGQVLLSGEGQAAAVSADWLTGRVDIHAAH
jgi:prepilin-type N-terminal cleavage/methylation domain-containing protein